MPVRMSTRQETRLRRLARELRTTIASQLGHDELAYASLGPAGDTQPWTADAERAWVAAEGTDPWRDHHLAVLMHARAYDLELERSDQAFEYWREALARWRAVIDDSTFWSRLHEEAAKRMGVPIDPDVVAEIRRQLPAQLLEPHFTLATTYRTVDRDRARRHIELVKDAGFDSKLVDSARATLVADVMARAPEAAAMALYDEFSAELSSWLAVDIDNPALLQALLYLVRTQNERLSVDLSSVEEITRNVAAVDAIAGEVIDSLEHPAGALAGEVARHEYWRGFVAVIDAEGRFSSRAAAPALKEWELLARNTVDRITRAKALDDTLTVDVYYADVTVIEAGAEKLWGLCRLADGPDKIADPDLAAQHLRRAVHLSPGDFEGQALLAHCLLAVDSIEALNEAEGVVARARALAEDSDSAREQVQELDRALHRQRSRRPLWGKGGVDGATREKLRWTTGDDE